MDQRPQCPHCRASLRVSQLVNCRFIADLSTVSVVSLFHSFPEMHESRHLGTAKGSECLVPVPFVDDETVTRVAARRKSDLDF
jgi:hypothetical protein